MQTTYTIRCTACGGENVLRDAWACWSYERQDWELDQVFDHTYCDDCEADCQIKRIEDLHQMTSP